MVQLKNFLSKRYNFWVISRLLLAVVFFIMFNRIHSPNPFFDIFTIIFCLNMLFLSVFDFLNKNTIFLGIDFHKIGKKITGFFSILIGLAFLFVNIRMLFDNYPYHTYKSFFVVILLLIFAMWVTLFGLWELLIERKR